MTQITMASGETFKTATVEGRLIEIFTYLQIGESDLSKNPNLKDYVQASFNANTLVFTANFSIPTAQSIDASGNILISAVNYLTNTTFNPGSGGTFKAASPAQYLIEVVTFLQNLELDTAKNPQDKNFVNSTYSADDGTYSGSVTLPLSMSFDDSGRVTFTAQEYLG